MWRSTDKLRLLIRKPKVLPYVNEISYIIISITIMHKDAKLNMFCVILKPIIRLEMSESVPKRLTHSGRVERNVYSALYCADMFRNHISFNKV